MAEFLRTMFSANQEIVLSVYGQVFFVLALAIFLQSWRHSRLALARTLQWLAAFGLTHAAYEWGDVFIPIQQRYLAAPFIDLLLSLQSVLLACSFACLFQFGVEALRPLPGRWRLLRWLPATMLLAWLGWSFGPALASADELAHWHMLTRTWARYGLGFPGALLAAYGLWWQATEIDATMDLPHLKRTLRIGAMALAGYSVLAGLIVRPGSFFPANRINTEWLERLFLIPVPVWRGLVGLLLMVAIVRSLEAFQVELDRRLIRMEEDQVLASERERIGRDIHDGTLQTIYGAGLLLQSVERDVRRDGAQPVLPRLTESIQLLNQAVADLRGHIGALRAPPDSRSLTAGLQELAERHLRSLLEVELALTIPDGQALAPRQIGHLLAIVTEALSNVARHANATQVRLEGLVRDDRLRLRITDNGTGMPEDYVVGYGLRNMHDRAQLLGGSLAVQSQVGHGTTVAIDVPWRVENERLATTGR